MEVLGTPTLSLLMSQNPHLQRRQVGNISCCQAVTMTKHFQQHYCYIQSMFTQLAVFGLLLQVRINISGIMWLFFLAAQRVVIISLVAGGIGLLVTVFLLLTLICSFCCCCYLCRRKSVPVDQYDLISKDCSSDWAGSEV